MALIDLLFSGAFLSASLSVLVDSLCLYYKLFLAALGTVDADLWQRLQVHSNTNVW